MYVRVQIITPPSQPVVTTDIVRKHTRVDTLSDDDLLSLYVDSATSLVQAYLNRSTLTRTLKLTWSQSYPQSSWPMVNAPYAVLPIGFELFLGGSQRGSQPLYYGPAQSVTSVSYRGVHDASDTILDPLSDYTSDIGDDPGRVRLQNQINWGIAQSYSVTYVAGYGDDPETVPVGIRHAIMLTAARMYECRGDEDGVSMLTRTAQSLLDPYRSYVFGN